MRIKFHAEVNRYIENDPCTFLLNECKASVDGELVIRNFKLEKLKLKGIDVYDEKLELEVLFEKEIIERNYEEGLHTERMVLNDRIFQWEEKYLKGNLIDKKAIEELLEAVKSGLTDYLNFEVHLIIAIVNLMENIIDKSEKFEITSSLL